MSRLSVLVLLVAAATGCDRSEPPSQDEAAPSEPEKKKPKRKKPKGTLEVPLVQLGAEKLKVNGEPAGSVAPIAKLGRVLVVEELASKLMGARMTWEGKHEGERHPGRFRIDADDDATTLALAAVIRSGVNAGLSRARLLVGERELPLEEDRSETKALDPLFRPGDQLHVALDGDEVKLVTTDQGREVGTATHALEDGAAALGAAAKKAIQAKPPTEVLLYAPHDTTLSQIQPLLEGMASAVGELGDEAPSVRIAHAERPETLGDGDPSNGRLPPEVVERFVRKRFDDLRVCYEKALAANPELARQGEAKFEVRFDIGRNGTTSSVRTSGDGDDPLKACITGVFEKLTFPKPEGGVVTITYPLVFTPP